jgi:dipeptidyl aminopeptidase/acylaminoacyl peptidase
MIQRRLTRTFGLMTLAVALATLAVSAQPARRSITLDDLAKIRNVGGPQVSPDGKWVAYTVGTTDAEKDKTDTDVWMTSWDGATHIRLTSTPDSENSPRWSPDNRYLAFKATRGTEEEKKRGGQVWLLDRSGGEAQKLTDIKGGVDDFAWSPDSKRLVIVSSDEDPAAEPEKLDGWKRKTAPPVVIDRFHFKQDREGYLKRLYSHLWLFDVAARKAEQLTKDQTNDADPAWSPDGTRIAFISNRSPDPDRNEDSNVFIIDAKTGAKPTQLTTYPGPDSGRPAWSPDGQWIAYLRGDDPKYYAYNVPKLTIVPSGGGAPRVLTEALDRNVSGPVFWTPDGNSLLFHVSDDRAEYLGKVAKAGGAVERLTAGRTTFSAVSQSATGALALIGGTPTAPGEVYALEGGTLRRLSHQNDELIAGLQLGTTEDITSRSKDGTVVNGLLTKPADFKQGTRYPTILYIHGGPDGQDDYSFFFDRELFAANGYVVLQVNYRGSAGRGSVYQKAIFADWGNKEVIDLLGAVDQAVASGIADPDRLGIGGWSYGGILTDYTIATTTRFKAAVSGAGSALQLSMYGHDQYIVQYELEIGQPWTLPARELWLKVSYPFFQADRIKTPTLFMGGDADFNVPLIGGEQMYQALKSLNIDTQLVIYPGQFHGLTTPSYGRDKLDRHVKWFDKYLKGGR